MSLLSVSTSEDAIGDSLLVETLIDEKVRTVLPGNRSGVEEKFKEERLSNSFPV